MAMKSGESAIAAPPFLNLASKSNNSKKSLIEETRSKFRDVLFKKMAENYNSRYQSVNFEFNPLKMYQPTSRQFLSEKGKLGLRDVLRKKLIEKRRLAEKKLAENDSYLDYIADKHNFSSQPFLGSLNNLQAFLSGQPGKTYTPNGNTLLAEVTKSKDVLNEVLLAAEELDDADQLKIYKDIFLAMTNFSDSS